MRELIRDAAAALTISAVVEAAVIFGFLCFIGVIVP